MFRKCCCFRKLGYTLCAVSFGMFLILVLPEGALEIILAIACLVIGVWLLRRCSIY